MKRAIEVIVRGVCVRGGRILLCHGKGKRNTYLPGGHVDPGEPAAAALVREIREELGVKARVIRFLGAVEHGYRQGKERVAEVNLVFRVEIPSLTPGGAVRSREDYIEFRWASLAKMRSEHLEPAVLCDVLPRWLSASGAGRGWGSTFDASLNG